MIKLFNIFGRYLSNHKLHSALAIVIGGFAALVEGLALTILFPIIASENSDIPIDQLFIFMCLAFLGTWSRFYNEKLILDIKVIIEKTIRDDLSSALINMKWSEYIYLGKADITKALVMEGLQISSGVQQLLSGLSSLLAAIAYFFLSLYVSTSLALILFVFCILSKLIYNNLSKVVENSSSKLSDLSSSIAESTSNLFSNMQYIRSTGLSEYALTSAKIFFDNFANYYRKANLPSFLFRGYFETAATVSVIAILLFQTSLLKAPTAELLVILTLFYRMLPKLMSFQSALMQCKSLKSWENSYRERLNDILVQQEDIVTSDQNKLSIGSGIFIKNVSYSYDSKQVLKNLSLNIPRGSHVAIVGFSGSGKSTLTNLLVGLIQPEEGIIMAGDVTLNSKNIQSWRNNIAIVLQTTFLISSTVAENIALGSPTINREKVRESLYLANASEFVSELPNGIDTILGDGALNLSGGQKQRLSIARSIYRDPQFLILDEATSSLDNISESKVIQSIRNLKGKVTVLTVTHRLDTIKGYDMIHVLHKGVFVESGSWEKLMNNRSFFYNLYQSELD